MLWDKAESLNMSLSSLCLSSLINHFHIQGGGCHRWSRCRNEMSEPLGVLQSPDTPRAQLQLCFFFLFFFFSWNIIEQSFPQGKQDYQLSWTNSTKIFSDCIIFRSHVRKAKKPILSQSGTRSPSLTLEMMSFLLLLFIAGRKQSTVFQRNNVTNKPLPRTQSIHFWKWVWYRITFLESFSVTWEYIYLTKPSATY